MHRRELLRLLAMGVVGHTLDVDRLLWVPGQKTIFLPSRELSISEMIIQEWEKVIYNLPRLYDRDIAFYNMIGRNIDVQIIQKAKN